MEQFSPDSIWMLAGVLVAIITAIGKRFGWVADDRISKQLTALGFSILSVVALPALAGQPVPAMNAMLMSVLQTWLAAMATYSVANTVQKSVAGPAEEGK